MQRRPPHLGNLSGTQDDDPARLGPRISPADSQSGETPTPVTLEDDLPPTLRLATPMPQPDGALRTQLGEPARATALAGATRAAQARTQQDLGAIAADLAQIAAALHAHTGVLETAVEGRLAADVSDPRSRLLAETLDVERRADLRLAQLGAALGRLAGALRASEAGVEALQTERERLAMLYQIAQELNSEPRLEEVLGGVLAHLIAVVRAERGFIMLAAPGSSGSSELRFTAARGADGEPLTLADFSISRTVVASVWSDLRPLLTTDAQSDERLSATESVVNFGIRSVMCAPLLVRGRGVGVVYVDSRMRSHLFDTAHLDLLAALCNQAAIAIENARLFDDLRARIREISTMKSYMDNIFASIASGVITTDTQGTVTAFNRAAEHIVGWSAQLAIGKPYQQVLAGLGDAPLDEIISRAARDGATTLGHPVERNLPDRGEVALRLNVSALRSGEGEALGVAMVVDDLTELRRTQRQARQIERLFGQYVHPAVVRQLLADPQAVKLGGELRTVSVLFADIRGYTALAERLAPEGLVDILNTYLDLLTAAVWQEEGTLTTFIGDALMAIFNAPLAQPDHPARAVRAALGMRTAVNRLQRDVTARGLAPVVGYGIGVSTGEAVVGNIGARDRLQQYTAIGDTVNTAQRLQAAAAAGQILITAPVYHAVAGHVHARELEPLLLKGKSQPLAAYELQGLR